MRHMISIEDFASHEVESVLASSSAEKKKIVMTAIPAQNVIEYRVVSNRLDVVYSAKTLEEAIGYYNAF